MTEKANHTIVVGKGEDAKTINAGEPLPSGLPAEEIARLRAMGAIGSPVPPGVGVETTAEPIAQAGERIEKPGAKAERVKT